jgi:RNA polymerase sigma factor (sigma-70 family)
MASQPNDRRSTAGKMSDEDLVQSVRNSHDPVFFETLYHRYVNKVYRKCLSMTTNPEQAEDLTQDVFMKVHRNIDRFKGRSRFSTWLYAITHHHVVDELQNRLPSVRLEPQTWANLPHNESPDTVSPDEQWQQVKEILEQLPDTDRDILLLRYEQGLGIEEISQMLGLGISAVKMRLSRSRTKLKKLIEELENP